MRAIEALLTDEPQTIHDLACQVYGVAAWDDLTRAQLKTVRRASKRLEALGRAYLKTRQADSVSSVARRTVLPAWGPGSRPRYLTARTPRTAEERERDHRRTHEAIAGLAAAMRGSAGGT